MNQGPSNHVTAESPCLTSDVSLTSILGTCVATVEHRGSLYRARALLDNGSAFSFVTSRFVTQLGLRKISQPTCIKGFQQAETPAIKYRVDFTLRVPTGTVTILKLMRALVIENIIGDLPSGLLPAVRGQPYLQGLQLADPSFDKPGQVEMLLGVDSLPFIMGNSISYSDWATETAYGWVISGTCQSQQSTPRSHLYLAATTIDQQTQDLLISFLEAEILDTTEPILTQEEQRAEDHFIRTHSRHPDGRYVVQLPRKADPPELGCSRDQALRRHRQNT